MSRLGENCFVRELALTHENGIDSLAARGGFPVDQSREVSDVVRFADFEANLRSRELFRRGRKVKVPDQSFAVLVLLLERPGSLVSREQIQRGLWSSDTFVDFDHGLNNAINRLREALGDSADVPKFVETLPRRGYKFIGVIEHTKVPGTEELTQEVLRAKLTDSRPQTRFFGMVTIVALTAVASIAALLVFRPHPKAKPDRPRAIAVLPLQNSTGNTEFDFLRIGLADDIATTLSSQPAFSIRPSAIANRYAASDLDLQRAAREMRVANIITGHYLVSADHIEVTLEAIDPIENRVVWRDSVRSSVQDLSALERQISAHVQRGLIAGLGLKGGFIAPANVSQNAEAYELYLRALAAADQPFSTGPSFASAVREAIKLLDRAVALDPGYAPAWAALGHDYYYDIGFGEGGNQSKLRAKAALQRAIALDHGRVDAASDLVNIKSEEGLLNEAYDDIIRLLQERPDNGSVHLVYAYVLWYGGLLEEAAQECDKARFLDPGTTDLASCGQVFWGLGKYERARAYLQLVAGSEYEAGGLVEILIREGRSDEALQKARSLPASSRLFYGTALLEPCLRHISSKGNQEADRFRERIMGEEDPFSKYALAAWDSFCNEPEHANRELRLAIEQNYCAYPQMETDPLLTSLRTRPEFAQLRSLGIACQQRFSNHRKEFAASSQ
jgi:DNA-binding winged helix-turn-helix (wHTH) protein/TolB-like protein